MLCIWGKIIANVFVFCLRSWYSCSEYHGEYEINSLFPLLFSRLFVPLHPLNIRNVYYEDNEVLCDSSYRSDGNG